MTYDDYETIACPWCGKEMGDLLDYFPGELWRDGSSVDLDCRGCGEPIAMTMSDGMRMSEPVRFTCERRGRRRLSLTRENWWQEIDDIPNPVARELLHLAVSRFLCGSDSGSAATDRKIANLVREVGETIELEGERLRLHKSTNCELTLARVWVRKGACPCPCCGNEVTNSNDNCFCSIDICSVCKKCCSLHCKCHIGDRRSPACAVP